MTEINLVSSKLAPSESEKKIAKYLKTLSFIITPVMVVAIAGIFIFSLVNTARINSLEKQKDELTSKLKSLESVEQQYVFILDRVQKLKEIKNQKDSYNDYLAFKEISENIPEGVSFTEGTIDAGRLEISYSAESSKVLTELFSTILANSEYNKILLRDFNFRSERGYSFSFELSKT